MKRLEIEIQSNDQDELYLQFPDDLMKRLDWEEGDELQFVDNKDGSFTIKKVKMSTIELDFTEEEYFKFLQAAHDADLSFNEYVNNAVRAFVTDIQGEEV